MVATSLPRSYTGSYSRLRVKIERHIAIRGEKKEYHTEKKCSLYRLLLCEKWK